MHASRTPSAVVEEWCRLQEVEPDLVLVSCNRLSAGLGESRERMSVVVFATHEGEQVLHALQSGSVSASFRFEGGCWAKPEPHPSSDRVTRLRNDLRAAGVDSTVEHHTNYGLVYVTPPFPLQLLRHWDSDAARQWAEGAPVEWVDAWSGSQA